MIDDPAGDQREGVVLRDRVGLSPPLHGPQERLALGVDALVIGAGTGGATQQIVAVGFAIIDIGPEIQVLVEPLAAARMLRVARPAHRAHFEDQLVAHPRIIARTPLRDLAPFLESLPGIGERDQRRAVAIREARAPRDLHDDIEVAARLARRFDRLQQQVDAAIGIGDAAGLLAPHRCPQGPPSPRR